MGFLLALLWILIVTLLPLLGVWVGSSLAVYLGGPVWLAVTAGALLFPVLPLLWEAWASARYAKSGKTGKRVLTTWDRIVLRTLAISLLFLAVVLWRYPAKAFAALSARGDWFLEGRQGPVVEAARGYLFKTAGGVEWLYNAVRKNPYKKDLQQETPTPEGPREPAPVAATPEPAVPSPTPEAPPVWLGDGPPPWPLPAELHPLVASMPAEAEASVDSVARYIVAGESNRWRRLKALHDYVADRVAYDAPAYVAGQIPKQDAATVFARRTAVCAGYANLLAALGSAAGEDIVVVPGDARNEGGDLTGEGHAWNAARVDGRWVLMDATWNAGSVNGSTFEKRYKTFYLFPPPEVLGVSHFPEDPAWQLRVPALSRGEFFRQPMLRASFFANGLKLLRPDRSQVTAEKVFQASMENPKGRFLMAKLEPAEGGEKHECRVLDGSELSMSCDLPGAGAYRVKLFVGPQKFGTYWLAGELLVQSKG